MRDNVHTEESDEQNPRRANNGRRVQSSSLEAGPWVAAVAVAVATVGVVPRWEAACREAICNAGEA